MERYLRLFASLVLFLLLATSSEMGAMRGAEGRMCESASHSFKGPCARDSNCASVCKTEGFPDGDCRGLRRRCFCRKPC